MCILLWTTPANNHPRFKFVFASNRDEFMRRPASRPHFWDLTTIFQQQQPQGEQSDSATTNSASPLSLDLSSVGILSSLDLQPVLKAEDYDIEIECSSASTTPWQTPTLSDDSDSMTLRVQAKNIPGTWLGITTHGDLVALTNYREDLTYRPSPGFIPLSRGKIPSEYLASMAASHAIEQTMSQATDMYLSEAIESTAGESTPNINTARRDLADAWIHKLAKRWERDFEGFNLLVVHEGGNRQYVGSNREGAQVHILASGSHVDKDEEATNGIGEQTTLSIPKEAVTGISNSVFNQPWEKVKCGAQALQDVLNKSLATFGADEAPHLTASDLVDEQTELAWMAIQLLTMMRVHTKPFPPDCTSPSSIYESLRERIFVPQVAIMPIWGPGSTTKDGLPPPHVDYGTRSSTIVLFGRKSNVVVYVDKVWYGDWDSSIDGRPEYPADSPEGLVWWQGQMGQPPATWKQTQGEELEQLLLRAKSVDDPKSVA